MYILIAGSVRTYCSSEEQEVFSFLKFELRKAGHQVDDFMLPYIDEGLSTPEQAFSYRMFDTSNCERLITVGYPACLLQHRNKHSILFSLFPQLGEYFGTEFGVAATPQYNRIRTLAWKACEEALLESQTIYCGSKLLKKDIFNNFNIRAEDFYFSNKMVNIEHKLSEISYVLAETCFDSWERPEIMIDMLESLDKRCKLVLFAVNPDQQYIKALQERAKTLNVLDKLEIRKGSADQKMIAGSLAFLDISYKSRRIKNRVLQAILLGVPIITSNDSGAILEVVEEQKNGIVVNSGQDKVAKEIAAAVNLLLAQPALRRQISSKCHNISTKMTNMQKIVEEMVR